MKKTLPILFVFSVFMYACLPAFPGSPAPAVTNLSNEELQGTAEVLSQQTLQALPTPSSEPSQTPVVMSATSEIMPNVTLTNQLQTPQEGIPTNTLEAQTCATSTTMNATAPSTAANTPTLGSPAPTNTAESLHPRFYGTLPPNLPSGEITLVNKSKSEAYISMQCTTQDGYVTIIEYPVKFKVVTRVPSGKCKIVGWVGGVKMTGGFSLSSREAKTINIFKDRIEVK